LKGKGLRAYVLESGAPGGTGGGGDWVDSGQSTDSVDSPPLLLLDSLIPSFSQRLRWQAGALADSLLI
jgi:hypothetical protein